MSFTILLAGQDIQSFATYVKQHGSYPDVTAQVEPSEYRDQTIVQLLVSTAVATIVKSVFDLLKDYLKDHWSRSKAGAYSSDTVTLRVGTKEIVIRRDMSTSEIDSLIADLQKAAPTEIAVENAQGEK
jgi:hypothetical protein